MTAEHEPGAAPRPALGPCPVLPEPAKTLSAPAELLAGYLDFYRSEVLRKLDGLSEAELRSSRLPTGWTPLQLLKHLAYMERRWLQWSFAGEDIPEPFGDRGPGDRSPAEPWLVAEDETVTQIRAFYDAQSARSREIAGAAQLSDRAVPAPRFAGSVPSLSWILFHVLQEYARHAGHLDIVRELADGQADND
ncbi:MAG TPA: DinB family protein [Streptosporangiaceae bacterium]